MKKANIRSRSTIDKHHLQINRSTMLGASPCITSRPIMLSSLPTRSVHLQIRPTSQKVPSRTSFHFLYQQFGGFSSKFMKSPNKCCESNNSIIKSARKCQLPMWRPTHVLFKHNHYVSEGNVVYFRRGGVLELTRLKESKNHQPSQCSIK